MTAPIHHLRATLGERLEDARAAREPAPEPYRLRDAARDVATVWAVGGLVIVGCSWICLRAAWRAS